MALKKIFCPECGNETQVNDEKKFGFCIQCGSKIILNNKEETEIFPDKPHSETNNKCGNQEIERRLEEVAFYYQLSQEKNEYENYRNDPKYYIKAQDILIDLSQVYPDDFRIWWELCKPVDFINPFVKDENADIYNINEDYFNKALDKAGIEQKRRLIKEHDSYIEKKENLKKEILKKKEELARLEQEQKEKEARRLEAERLERERVEKEAEEKRLEQERLKREAEEKRLEQERLEKEKAEARRLEAERIEKEKRKKEAENKKLEQEKIEREANQKREEEKKQKEEKYKTLKEGLALSSVKMWSELENKDYSAIDNSYFVLTQEDGQKIIGVFKCLSNIIYLMSLRINSENSNKIYLDQNISIKFNNQGQGLKFDNKPVKIRDLIAPNDLLQIFSSDDGDLFVNGFSLIVDKEYVTDMIKRAKKSLLNSKKMFI
ncbi:MAG: hypothetical protein ACI4I9_06840 [Porcipelethomonas sp.]